MQTQLRFQSGLPIKANPVSWFRFFLIFRNDIRKDVRSQQLWREIRERGFPGTSKQVIRWVQQTKAGGPLRPPALLTPKQLVWVLLNDREQLKSTEQAFLEFVCQDMVVQRAYSQSQSFRSMVRERQAERFQDWLSAAEKSTITELKHFASGLRQDTSAIFSALKENWSNAQTEGQNTRLKLLKRQMYGRAKLDLLRQRVLYRTL
ncbi:MAG: transposase [Anaerolineales bacterium]|nr:transposase [Anaerolineales bacterium]